MTKSVFYSWQSDLPTNTNRNFIRNCLDRAIKAINKELGVDEAKREPLKTEDGVKGIPGTPDVANMIFERIDKCEIFVADISVIGKIPKGRRVQNPNVMIEYGRASKSLGDQRILTVFNEAFGNWENDRPFDLQHKLRPITYRLTKSDSEDERQIARDVLSGQLVRALKEILGTLPVDNTESPARTLSNRAAELQASRQFAAEKKQFCDSSEGVKAARTAFTELADLVQSKAKEIAGQHDHVGLNTIFHNGFLVVHGLGPVLVISWNSRFSNSLNESSLQAPIYNGSPELPGFTPVFDKPSILSQNNFEYTLIEPEREGYIKQDKEEVSYTIEQMVDYLLSAYFSASEDFETP